LKKWVEQNPRLKDWTTWQGLSGKEQTKNLKEIPLANLPTAEQFFSDFYGAKHRPGLMYATQQKGTWRKR